MVENVSMYFAAVGHSEFAKFDQFGNEEPEPHFPYKLKYIPNTALSTMAEDYPDET